MTFGLLFFASTEDALRGQDKYKLIIEAARFGDQHGFSSVWVPERHFTEFGSLYPSPAILQAALSRETQRIRLMAGSVVMPLHNPLRVAEEWSMVDNLSGGRVGISFAAGWNPNDFAFFPDRYADRHEAMYPGIRQVQQLWAGQAVDATNGKGQPIRVGIYPKPLQPELPTWITAASNPATFVKAGQIGANVLTHTLDHDNTQLAEKIALYRQARADNGYDPATGIVSVLLHTFVGNDLAQVRDQARQPYCDYMRTNIGLLSGLAQSRGQELDLKSMKPAELDEMLNYLFDRFAAVKGLIGTPESCLDLVHDFDAIGVNELACLLDFGPSNELILGNLPHLHRLKNRYESGASPTRTVPDAPPVRRQEIRLTPAPPALPTVDRRSLAAIRSRCGQRVAGSTFYDELAQAGIHYGSGFRGIEQLWLGDAEVLASVRLPADLSGTTASFSYHPAFLDACFQVFMPVLASVGVSPDDHAIPVGFRQWQGYGALPDQVYSYAYLESQPSESTPFYVGNLLIFNEQGDVLVDVTGFKIQPLRAVTQRRPTDLYEVQWQPTTALCTAPKATTTDHFLILADQAGVGQALARQLQKQGHSYIVLYPPDTRQPAWVQGYLTGMDEQIQPFLPGDPTANLHVFFLWTLDSQIDAQTSTGTLLAQQQFLAESLRRLTGLLTEAKSTRQPTLWLVTQAGQCTSPADESVAVLQGAMWGLGRVLINEGTSLRTRLIDLAPNVPDEAAAQLLRLLNQPPADNQLAIRAGTWLSPRLVPMPVRSGPTPPIDPDASYVITGGLGGLGLELADALARQGARQLVLLGRRTPNDEDTIARLAQLEAAGCAVTVLVADVTQFDALQTSWRQLTASHRPVKGVFHLAGVLDDAPLSEQTIDRFTAGSAAKLIGAFHLHQLTRDLSLDYFVLFSSVSSVLGPPRQASYATANAFLDALAHHRHAQGLPALSINWGPWSGRGHAATDYGRDAHRQLAQVGIDAWAPADGFAQLMTLLAQPTPQYVALRADWATLFNSGISVGQSVVLQDLHPVASAPQPTQSAPATPIERTRLLTASADEAPALLRDYLTQLVGRALKLTPAQLAPDRPLTYLGLDSLMAIELKNRINTDLNVEYRVVRFMEGVSLHQLEHELTSQLAPHWASTPEAPPAAELPQPIDADDDQETYALLADLSAMTDEQLDDLLTEMGQA